MSKIENVVSPVPTGSARQIDVWRDWSGLTNWWGRGSSSVGNLWNTASNFGFPSSTEQNANRNGMNVQRRRNGATGSSTLTVPVITLLIGDLAFPNSGGDIFCWECSMEMTVATPAGTENGAWFSNTASVSRVYSGSGQGFGISCVDGTEVRFFQNGPLGVTDEVISGVDPFSWHHYRFVITNAKSVNGVQTDASMDLYVDDVKRVTKSWGVAADNMPSMTLSVLTFQTGIATGGADEWIYYRDLHFFMGPRNGIGVL